MFAIVETGGKQFRVEEGLTFKVEKLSNDSGLEYGAGDEVVLDKVLLVSDGSVAVGKPYVDSAKVTCEVVDNDRGKKLVVFKKWRRNDSRKKQGHRQWHTTLKVKSIQK